MKSPRLSPRFLAALVLAAAAASSAVSAAENDGKANPYESIVERNPFALRPPPPPTPPDTGPPAPPPPLATVELTGVTSIFSKKKALVEIVPGPGKPPMKLTLDEGERVDAIEIVAIDVEKAEVTINNAGTVTNISLKVAKAPTGPAVGAPPIPGLIQPPGINPAIPTPINPLGGALGAAPTGSRGGSILAGGNAAGATPSAAPALNFGGAQPITTYGGGGVYTGAGASGVGAPGGTPGLINRPIRTQTAQTPQGQAPAVDPAVQYINMAVQKQQMESRGVVMPPLPPVPGLDPQ